MQLFRRRLGPRGLHKDVRPVVCPEVVPGVGGEDVGSRVCRAPVCANIEDLACLLALRLYWVMVQRPRGVKGHGEKGGT